jgi:predicted ABC-type ATPase
MPELFIIAGCNGAGKTNAAYNLLPEVFQTTEFINADEIARGINKDNVEDAAMAAARLMLTRIEYLIENKQSFAFKQHCLD